MSSKRTRYSLKSALWWALGSIFIVAPRTAAQDLPRGAYQPIPNFTGVGALEASLNANGHNKITSPANESAGDAIFIRTARHAAIRGENAARLLNLSK